jgi:predicted dehydrogenase
LSAVKLKAEASRDSVAAPRVCVIGTGWAGEWVHTRGWKAAGIDPVAVADLNVDRARRLSTEYEIPHAYADWREMLERENPDVVSVAVPNAMHEELVVAALEHGAHVICEKPISISVGSAQRMFDTARANRRWLMAAQQYRWEPGAVVVKEAIDRGELGEIYYSQVTALRRLWIPGGGVFHRRQFSGGGPMFDIGVHMLDQAIWLLGNPTPVSVSATLERRFGDRPEIAARMGNYPPADYDVEDFAVAFVRFKEGITMVLRASWALHMEPYDDFGNEVFGTLGSARTIPTSIHTERNGRMVDETFPHLPQVSGYEAEIAHFLAVVRGETEPLVREEETMNVQRILNAAYDSADAGAEVRL